MSDPVRYPTDHVVAILDAPEQISAAVSALTGGGFLESEIEVISGKAAAKKLEENTGRTGLSHLAIRIAERLGVANYEMQVKDRYEEALRAGKFVLTVLAKTEERKDQAARILVELKAQFINIMGRFTIETVRA